MSARAAEPDDASNPLATIRARDDVRIHVRGAYLTFTETIVLTPAGVTAQRMGPGTMNSVNLLIAPFWFSDGSNQGPAFPVLRPQVTPSHGRVKRFALVRPDGEAVCSLSEATPDCRYVLTLEFGHMPPERLTVTVPMASPFGLRPGAIIRDRAIDSRAGEACHGPSGCSRRRAAAKSSSTRSRSAGCAYLPADR